MQVFCDSAYERHKEGQVLGNVFYTEVSLKFQCNVLDFEIHARQSDKRQRHLLPTVSISY